MAKASNEIKPGRDPIIRTAPSPADMNGNGDIFGGWVLSQMDIAGGIAAARAAQGRVATVAVAGMTFNKPIKVGDVVSIYGEIERIGTTSITVRLETIVQRRLDAEPIKVTEGTFVFVAIDRQGKPRPIPAAAKTPERKAPRRKIAARKPVGRRAPARRRG